MNTGEYGNATYFISDDGSKTGQLQVFRGYYLEGETVKYKVVVKNEMKSTIYDVKVQSSLTGDKILEEYDELTPTSERRTFFYVTVPEGSAKEGKLENYGIVTYTEIDGVTRTFRTDICTVDIRVEP